MKTAPLIHPALLIGLATFAAIPAGAQQRAAIAITHVTVVDVADGKLVPDQTVVVTGNRISALGASVRVPAGVRVLDARGKFLIPGLWDMHVHVASPPVDQFYLPLLVANGVTGVRDMFGRIELAGRTKQRVARGMIVGPRVVASGHIMDGSPPVWQGSVVVRDAKEATRAVDSLADLGADFIKVYSRLGPEAYRAIAAEAKRRGLPFVGHVPTLVSATEASDLGQLSIEHLTGVLPGCSSHEDAIRDQLVAALATSRGWDSATVISRAALKEYLDTFDASKCESLARRFASNGTWMVPTLVTLHATGNLDDSTLAADPRMRYVPIDFREYWKPGNDFRFKSMTPADWAIRHRVYAKQLELVGILHAAGARFMAGTDLLNPYTYAGFSLHEELARLVEAGLTPTDALRAATIAPAQFLRMTDSLGTVEAGKLADLVLLDADPLADIHNTSRIAAVMVAGRLLDRKRLDELLEVAARAAKQHYR